MNKPVPTLIRRMSLVAVIIIVLMPFHAFASVWATSFIGVEYYTAVRLWKELLLIGLAGCLAYLLATQPKIRLLFGRERVMRLIAAYLVFLVVVGLIASTMSAVSPMAFLYGLLLDSRFLVFFAVTWLVGQYTDVISRLWQRLLLIPGAIVVGFAALQYAVLPTDFLSHFGYGRDTIPPSLTVDQKDAYLRVQSTLRGANPLGAYLVLILSALGELVLRARGKRWPTVALYILSGLALVFTFSRSAWIGATAAMVWLLWTVLRSERARRNFVIAGASALIAFTAVGYALRDNDHFQNVFFHTDEHSKSGGDSNSGHFWSVVIGLQDVAFEPWGQGTGTAGPASVYNEANAPRIAENYYVQIAQEVGIVGLLLFAAINVLVALRLWRLRVQALPRILLASLIGITLVNMLLHAWTDDTLAYIWWGLAGAAIATSDASTEHKKHETAP